MFLISGVAPESLHDGHARLAAEYVAAEFAAKWPGNLEQFAQGSDNFHDEFFKALAQQFTKLFVLEEQRLEDRAKAPSNVVQLDASR